ncbi:alkaline phosphatase family protein [Caldimonas brevitalea]|uniref:Type I phosphodiesterase/nucleotide pyrophosphatase n=1 Tax=Caldimonas brevitalea TaxID=413882 RepID=A0A0G3BPB0_9BURK|nr:alkaline phosphatase family protein [Caldimonas brevitalea]AKJ29783.1 hypothetical protein AAW51_3092 [Caldimonas brevitalea]
MLPRTLWLLVDGLSFELLRAYTSAQPDSTMGRLWREQRVRPLLPLAPNCQTPPSLFTIWSGCPPERHGLTGAEVPVVAGGDPTAFRNGFDVWPRDVPMVWDLYAARGQTVRTCAVPFVEPLRLFPRLLSATEVFSTPLAAPALLAPGQRLSLPALQLDLRVRGGADGLRLEDPQGRVVWAARLHGPVLPLPHATWAKAGESHRALALQTVVIDDQPQLVFLGYHAVKVHGRDAERRRMHGRARPYVAANPGRLYQERRLGVSLRDGGTGAAETLLVALMRHVHDSFANDIRWAVEGHDADLTVGYYPLINQLSHQILCHAVRPDGSFSGPLAPAFLRVMGWLDEWITKLRRSLPDDWRFVIHSDHGVAPVHWDLHPNRYFRDRGWLQRSSEGRIDARRSLVFFHPAENGLLVFHRQRLQEAGLTTASVVEALADAVASAGLSGLGVLQGVPAPFGAEWESGHYLQSPAGVRPRAAIDAALVCRSQRGGDHTVYADHPWLRGALLDAGPQPWLAPGAEALALSDLMPQVLERRSAVPA